MTEGLHLTPKGFLQILHFSYFINSTTSRTSISIDTIIQTVSEKFNSSCYNNEAIKNPFSIEPTKTISKITTDYIAGLFDGDGCLSFIFSAKHRYVGCNFTIIQHIDDYEVLLQLKEFLVFFIKFPLEMQPDFQ